MEPILNSQLPEFSVQAFQNGAFKTVTNNDLKGKWAILFCSVPGNGCGNLLGKY